MKTLHRFKVSVPQEVEKTETLTRDGKQITETQKVVQSVDHYFILKQMSRSETDSARLFNGASLKRAIDANLITKSVLVQKHIDGNGSLISQDTAKRIVQLNEAIQKHKNDIVSLGVVGDDETKQKKQLDLLIKFDEASRELSAIESSNRTVFDATAENYAAERSNLWIMLNQTYVERNGKPEQFFKGANFDEKENSLENYENDKDPLYLAAVGKLSNFWGYYLSGNISTPEQFQKLEEALDKQVEESKQAEDEAKKEAEATQPKEVQLELPLTA